MRRMTALETKLQAAISEANSPYTNKLVSEFVVSCNSKKFSHITSISKLNQIPPNMYFKDISVSSDLEKANLFNNYFFSVY